jgi:hypothetical protein
MLDIFLSCTGYDGSQTFQIWLNTPGAEGFHLGRTGQLPPGSGRITFADMGKLCYVFLSNCPQNVVQIATVQWTWFFQAVARLIPKGLAKTA